MQQDANGFALATDSEPAARAYDATIASYLTYRLDTPLKLKAALAEDPEFGLLHVLKGSFALLTYKQASVPAARAAYAAAERFATSATARERAHVAAFGAWVDDRIDRALAIWEAVLAEHPQDILAFRLHHFCAFWTGRADRMLAAVEGVMPHWHPEVPHWGAVLACRAFANEECGNYSVAELSARAAIALDPGDLWAVHALAHVMEMQGRRGEGIETLERLRPHFEGKNNLLHHVLWHQALYHLERGEWDAVLALYDHGFRDLASPLTQLQPDLYIDMQNAASMLFRLERCGVDVGTRWEELAEKAEARIGDCRSAFTLPHWMMALCATGRLEAAERMLAAMRGNAASVVSQIALPVSDAVLMHARGYHAGAVAAMRPVLGEMHLLGGSHAQQDVLEQLFLDAAMKAGATGDTRLLLERVAGRCPVPPERRIGYRDAAAAVRH